MRSAHLNRLLQIAVAGACVVTLPASAQDIGGLLRGLMQGRPGDLADVIRSVADVSVGQLGGGVQGPQDADGKVVLYRTAWCGYCKQAAAYMQQKNIPFVERDIERNSAYKAEFSRFGGNGVPLLLFGSKTMRGFSQSTFDLEFRIQTRASNYEGPELPAEAGVGGDGTEFLDGGLQIFKDPWNTNSNRGSIVMDQLNYSLRMDFRGHHN